MTFDETALPILVKGKNTNTKLIFWEMLQCRINSELTAMKNNANKSLLRNNRSDPKNYTKTALFLFHLLIITLLLINCQMRCAFGQIDQTHLTQVWCMTSRLCTSTTTHTANVRYCKFSKMPSMWVGYITVRTPPRGSDRVRSMPTAQVSDSFHIFTARRVCIAWTMPWQHVCPSLSPSVCHNVCHTPVLCLNG